MKIKNKLLSEAKRDELGAPIMYSKLLKTLPNPKQKSIIKNIIKDERRHLKLLKNIK